LQNQPNCIVCCPSSIFTTVYRTYGCRNNELAFRKQPRYASLPVYINACYQGFTVKHTYIKKTEHKEEKSVKKMYISKATAISESDYMMKICKIMTEKQLNNMISYL